MRTITSGPITVTWFSCNVGVEKMQLTTVVKGTFSLFNDGTAHPNAKAEEAQGDVFWEDMAKGSLSYSSDFAPFKPSADILCLGTAYSPGGQNTTELKASLRVGRFAKAIIVMGDRFWERHYLFWRRPSSPATFKSKQIKYEHSYGGGNFKRNPVGVGFDKKKLPNVESQSYPIRKPGDRPLPAGFGPIAATWEPRCSKVGSYGGNWLKERWPWFPDDFDWGYFNASPEDQQLEGYLRGDEELEFQNLHPEHSIYRSRLPGLRARAFVQIEMPDTQPEFREVKMNLDTLWIDMESEKLVLVWRGLTPIRSLKFQEVTHLAVLTEPLTSPLRSKDEMREWMNQKIREEKGEGPPGAKQAAEAAAEKASQESFEKEMAAMALEKAELEKEFSDFEKEAEIHLALERTRLIEDGLDPKFLEQPPKLETMTEIKTQLTDEVARLSEIDPQAAAKLAEVGQNFDELEAMEKEFAALDAEDGSPPSPETVQVAVAEGRPLIGADLSGLDFSNRDLSGADFSGADFSKANMSKAKLVKCRLVGANFSGTNLTGADFTRAVLDGADFSEAKLEGAKFPGTSIEGTSFSELQLPGADFSECKGRHPNFSSSNLEGVNFSRAKLPQADFCRANVKAANFNQAELASADFGGAVATGINMEKADLTNLRAAEKSNFTGGKFREAKAPTSIWEGAILDQADFSRAVLTGALFEEASLKETRFDRAELTKAVFDDAQAQKAILTNANLLRASFNRTNLTAANLAGSNLYEASFWETVFHHTNIDGANIKRTSIA